MEKNHYLVLGIAPDASPREIKEAYRNLAKAFHPDHYGKNQAPFLEIQKAYSVLSDPVKRRRHDRAIQTEKPLSSRRSRPTAGMPVEPLIPEASLLKRSNLWDSNPGSRLFQEPEPLIPDRTATGRAGLEPLRDTGRWPLNPQVEILLTPEQAMRGGETRISLPGYGTLLLSYSPGVGDREGFRINLGRLGPQRLALVVTFRVLPG